MHGLRGARLRCAALCAAAAVGLAGRAAAIDWERLVMPGPLAEAHADLEADCSNCHRPFERQSEGSGCLSCHEDVAGDVTARTGFHGRSGAEASGCRICHPDHQGRAADIVGLDEQTFAHDRTDFALHGAHAGLACGACHAAGARHRESPSDCVGCHAADDPHGESMSDDCASCHDDSAWKHAGFDHDETGFRLVGRHREADCGSCHPDAFYAGTPQDCLSCHAADDTHRGFLGPDCQKCHTPGGWREVTFRHERDTHFPLEGAHADAACRACHSAPPFGAELATDCASCHARDDVHRGRNGSDCGRCHTAVAWTQTSFDHDETRFPLRGSHASVLCSDCHSRDPFSDELRTDCGSCHLDDDVHAGQVGERCSECHRESGWRSDLFFEHDITRFPLLGMHAVAACDQCHVTLRFHDAPSDCAQCHRDTRHRGRLGPDCATCHNPNGWGLWDFDHQSTGFALRGAHVDVGCHDCHRSDPSAFPLSSSCVSCHAGDDEHDGAFGRDCERCHVETRWETVHVDR